MTMNIFKFVDTWWKQIIGTAMGTSCACVYATIFFAYYERTSLLPMFKDNLVVYVRYIDDIFLVWKETQNSPFKNFTTSLNNQCKLTWVTEKLSTSVNFLDLAITLDHNAGRFWTRTYQKDMNLFLYIPALSAYPPGLLKSLIYGLLETYWRQNSHSRDYTKFSQLLHKRLLARGHDIKAINLLFTEAAIKIEAKSWTKNKQPKTKSLTGESLFFHYEFHTRDISRQLIRNAYESKCELQDENGPSFRNMENASGDKLSIEKFTVCYSRPKNLRDNLVPSKLHETEKINVENILKSL